jgi:hypothetical protein
MLRSAGSDLVATIRSVAAFVAKMIEATSPKTPFPAAGDKARGRPSGRADGTLGRADSEHDNGGAQHPPDP